MKRYTETETDDVLEDGQSVRVSTAMMDAAARRPTHPDARQMADEAAMADARHRVRLQLAWRDATEAEIENEARRRLQTRQADEAALARHEAVHDARDAALMEAWKR